jgi:hypothetical protein
MKIYVCDEKTVQSCLSKLVSLSRIENHIIRSNPKNPRYGVDLAERFKKEVYPLIVTDVVDSLKNKQIYGDVVDEGVLVQELLFRLNIELVRLGIAMMPSVGQ